MNKAYASSVLTCLSHKVKKACGEARELELINNCDSSFTRKSKLGLEKTVNFILGSSSTTLNNEIERFYDGNEEEMVSPSAIVQSRNKIKPELFNYVFNCLNKTYPSLKAFNGYKLLAIDGTDIPIHFDPDDSDTYHGGRTKDNGQPGKPYSSLHLNAMYDIMNDRYIDYSLQGDAKADERDALLEMAKRYVGSKAIFIADRGYEQANLFELLNRLSPHKYLIRIKDIRTPNSFFYKFGFEDKEFDMDVDLTFTDYQRKEYTSNPKKYKIINKSNQRFDFLGENTHFYETKWRIVRVKKDDDEKADDKDDNNNYELLVTNLERDKFNPEVIRHLYKLRWDIETSFRYLKRSCNLLASMSYKRDLIKQEIIAKLIMYNASTIISEYLEAKRVSKYKRKHEHRIDINNAIHKIICSYYKLKRKGGLPPNLDSLISNKTSPVRPGRKYKRSSHATRYYSSTYRFY